MVLVKLYNMRKYQEKQSSQQNRKQLESADQHGRSSKRITFVMVCGRRSPLKLWRGDLILNKPISIAPYRLVSCDSYHHANMADCDELSSTTAQLAIR
jgi:hypothetical protein